MKKNYLSIIIALSAVMSGSHLHGFGKKTVFGIRSQGLNGVRELCGWQKCMFKYDENRNFGSLAATVEYDRSFRPEKMADFLFGGETMHFSGSQSPNRQPGDILADYFGLPIDFSSKVCVSPRISSVIVDFNLFQAFDGKIPGLFFMFHVPVVHTKWYLNMKESAIKPGTGFYPAGYMSNVRINASSLPQSVTQALVGATTFGDMQEPLQYGRIMGRQERSRVAEVQATLGYNYTMPWYHAGISFRVGAPTGNATESEFLFEEIVGNRHHWDVGIGLSGHVDMWKDKESGRCLALYGQANISHLCRSQQKRSFDLIKNGSGSRYMLMEHIDGPSSELWINGSAPDNQYIRKMLPVINQTTFDTKISIGVQADIVVKLAYQRDGFECDLGYNFWANSKEKMHSRCALQDNRFALKGDAQLYGFAENPLNDSVIIPLNATQSNATIVGGQGAGNGNFQNLNADNQPAAASVVGGSAGLAQLNNADSVALGIKRVQVQGSNSAVFLQDSDINNESGLLPRALSHKIFAFVNYTWNNRDDFDPYAGLGLSAELAHTSACANAMCSQWAIWFKTGFSY